MLQHHTVIVGSGFSGLGTAIRMKKAGLDDFIILERAQEVGGTWRENTYPGAACDVPSHVYSFSFAPSNKWSRKFAPQREILEYLKDCADRFDLRRHIRFRSHVESAVFDENTGLWTLSISGGLTIQARYFILASGGLSRPSYPKIEGLCSFEGALFHTAEWRHDYALKGKKVAVIGTGASAIQVVPAIAPEVGELKLFQRTPAWILPKDDFSFSQVQRRRLESWPLLGKLLRTAFYWQFEFRALGLLKPQLIKQTQKVAEHIIKRKVHDPEVQKKLTPDYTMGCKRILLSNDFYPTFNQKHVHLVSEGIERVTAKGVVSKDGVEHEVDAIICATGFQVAEACAPFPIIGREGKDLAQEWQHGAEAYLGTTVHGFPNMFIVIGPNTGLGHNSIVFMVESQVNYIVDAMQKLSKKGAKSTEVKAEVQKDYNDGLQERFKGTVWATGGCVSWYHDAKGRNTTLFPGFSWQLRLKTLRFDIAAYTVIPVEGRDALPNKGGEVLEPAAS